MKRINITIDEETESKLNALSAKNSWNVSQTIRQGIRNLSEGGNNVDIKKEIDAYIERGIEEGWLMLVDKKHQDKKVEIQGGKRIDNRTFAEVIAGVNGIDVDEEDKRKEEDSRVVNFLMRTRGITREQAEHLASLPKDADGNIMYE